MSTKTIVTTDTLLAVQAAIYKKDLLVFDTETTGLKPYHGAEIFSLAIGDLEGNAWYFNFKDYPGLDPRFVLPFSAAFHVMKKPSTTWVAHNAKFDLHFTDRAGLKPSGKVIDTQVMARLYENHHQFMKGPSGGYSLKACATRWLGEQKSDGVMDWMNENSCYSEYPGPEGRSRRDYHFDLVPFDIISDYAAQDVIVTAELYRFLRDNMYETELVDLEAGVTDTLFEIEKRGILLDREYCERALAHEKAFAEQAHIKLQELFYGFTDSAKCLAPYFEGKGITLPETEKGNPQLTDKVLQGIDDPVAKNLIGYREATKRASTYWTNYLYLPDDDNVVHPSFMQAGTTTGRLSCRDPNLQNIPSDDGGAYPVRRAFVPREGFIFVSIDYAQMEFRLMLEYAKQMDLIEQIRDHGHDPHDATAELTGLPRKAAKTLNFGLLYGMGIAKLAEAINVSEAEARSFKYKYFDRLPGVKRFIRDASDRMEVRGYTYNFLGRRFILEDKKWAYKAANAIIQGGCADICKVAMVRLRNLLATTRTKMVLQVHDEILFEVDKGEAKEGIVAHLRHAMESAYEARHLGLRCSVSYSTKSFGDLIEINELEDMIL